MIYRVGCKCAGNCFRFGVLQGIGEGYEIVREQCGLGTCEIFEIFDPGWPRASVYLVKVTRTLKMLYDPANILAPQMRLWFGVLKGIVQG